MRAQPYLGWFQGRQQARQLETRWRPTALGPAAELPGGGEHTPDAEAAVLACRPWTSGDGLTVWAPRWCQTFVERPISGPWG